MLVLPKDQHLMQKDLKSEQKSWKQLPLTPGGTDFWFEQYVTSHCHTATAQLCLTHSLCGCLCYSPFSFICEGTAFNQNTAVFRGQGAKGEGARTNARSLPFPVCSFTGEQLLRLPSPQPGRETAAACQLTGCRNSLWCWAVCVNHQLLFPERPFARRSCQAAEHGREQTCFTARNSCHNCLCELWGGLGHALEVT